MRRPDESSSSFAPTSLAHTMREVPQRPKPRAGAAVVIGLGVSALTASVVLGLGRRGSHANAPYTVHASSMSTFEPGDMAASNHLALGGIEIDRAPVTASAWQACQARGVCPTVEACGTAAQDGPVQCITWDEADAYCRAAHARLPSEAEMQRAGSAGLPLTGDEWTADPEAVPLMAGATIAGSHRTVHGPSRSAAVDPSLRSASIGFRCARDVN